MIGLILKVGLHRIRLAIQVVVYDPKWGGIHVICFTVDVDGLSGF